MLRALFLAAIFGPLALSVSAESTAPIRLAPDQLQQDGRITLSPGFSPDGQTIYFAQSECSPIWECPQTLKRAVRTDAGWSTPEPVSLPREGRVDWPSVSPDGRQLIFSWSADRPELSTLDIRENFDLYTLDLTDDAAAPVPISTGDINRPRAGTLKTLRYMHNETLPSLTKSGSLYFMTERPDGIGERDIYIARTNTDGRFSTAVPVSAPINSAERDDGVWVDADETIMLLSYPNRGGEGGADIFVSLNSADGWTAPRNLGDTINSPYQDFGARLSPDKSQIVFTSDRPFDGQSAGLLQVWTAPFHIADDAS
jgi:Tol biopolymer transport system component